MAAEFRSIGRLLNFCRRVEGAKQFAVKAAEAATDIEEGEARKLFWRQMGVEDASGGGEMPAQFGGDENGGDGDGNGDDEGDGNGNGDEGNEPGENGNGANNEE